MGPAGVQLWHGHARGDPEGSGHAVVWDGGNERETHAARTSAAADTGGCTVRRPTTGIFVRSAFGRHHNRPGSPDGSLLLCHGRRYGSQTSAISASPTSAVATMLESGS